MEPRRRGSAYEQRSEADSLNALRQMASGGGQPQQPAQRGARPDPRRQYAQQPRAGWEEAPAQQPAWSQGGEQQYPQQRAPAPSRISDDDLRQLKDIAQQVAAQREANQRKEAELQQREDALQRGTQLIMDQRDGNLRKEAELKAIAQELEGQARKFAEKENAINQAKGLLAEEESRRKKFGETFRSRENAIVQKETQLRTLEKELKGRESSVQAVEKGIKECPYCNVKYNLEGIRELLDEVRGYGMDLEELEAKYDKALEHLKSDAHDKALEAAQALLRDIRMMKNEVVAKGIQYLISTAAYTVGRAREKGLDVGVQEDLIKQAKAASERREFRLAEQYAKEAEYQSRDLLRGESLSVAQPPQAPPEARAPEPRAPAPRTPEPEYQPPAQPGPPSWSQAPAEQPAYQPAPEAGPAWAQSPAEQPAYQSVSQQGPAWQSVQQEAAPPQEAPAPDTTSQYQQYQPEPPQYQQYQPEPQAAPEPPSVDKKYYCTNCNAPFTIPTTRRPVKVNCPTCKTQMVLHD